MLISIESCVEESEWSAVGNLTDAASRPCVNYPYRFWLMCNFEFLSFETNWDACFVLWFICLAGFTKLIRSSSSRFSSVNSPFLVPVSESFSSRHFNLGDPRCLAVCRSASGPYLEFMYVFLRISSSFSRSGTFVCASSFHLVVLGPNPLANSFCSC